MPEEPEKPEKPKYNEFIKNSLASLIENVEGDYLSLSEAARELGIAIAIKDLRALAKQMGYRTTTTRIYKKRV